MRLSALTSTKTEAALPTAEIERNVQGWLLDSEIRQHSPATLAVRKIVLEKLLWFLEKHSLACCATLELRRFLSYLMRGHEEKGGRWGNSRLSRPVRPATVATYHRHSEVFRVRE
jgi:hypothetical protein